MDEHIRPGSGEPYVRCSSNPADRHPWQVRRNRPDQTYDVLSSHVTLGEAQARAERIMRIMHEGGDEGGVLQGAGDLLAAVERFEAKNGIERAANGGLLRAGTRVRCELTRKVGKIEILDRKRFRLWPWGIRWEDGSFEFCSASELAVLEAVIV